ERLVETCESAGPRTTNWLVLLRTVSNTGADTAPGPVNATSELNMIAMIFMLRWRRLGRRTGTAGPEGARDSRLDSTSLAYSTSLAVRRRFGRFGLGFGRRFGWARLAFAASGRGSRRGFLFRRLLVAVAAVIGNVKTAPFENDPRAASNSAFDFPFAPGFEAA